MRNVQNCDSSVLNNICKKNRIYFIYNELLSFTMQIISNLYFQQSIAVIQTLPQISIIFNLLGFNPEMVVFLIVFSLF
jgi:hypothetical protein